MNKIVFDYADPEAVAKRVNREVSPYNSRERRFYNFLRLYYPCLLKRRLDFNTTAALMRALCDFSLHQRK